MSALCERAIERHQDCLNVRALRAMIRVTVFANYHCRPDSSLRQIIVKGNSRFVEEGEEVGTMSPQPFDQPLGLRVLPSGGSQFVQAFPNPLPTEFEVFRRQVGLLMSQADRVAHQSPQLFGKLRPMRSAFLVVLHGMQVAQQMNQAALPGCANHSVVGPQKSLTNVPSSSSVKNRSSAGSPRERSIM